MVIFLIILAIIILNITLPAPGIQSNKKDNCPPHLWHYDNKDDMRCILCKKVPEVR